MTREELLYIIGKWLGYWTGHYDGWMAAAGWTQHYFQVVDYFAEASQAGLLIALVRGNVFAHEIDVSCDKERGYELASWLGKEAGRY